MESILGDIIAATIATPGFWAGAVSVLAVCAFFFVKGELVPGHWFRLLVHDRDYLQAKVDKAQDQTERGLEIQAELVQGLKDLASLRKAADEIVGLKTEVGGLRALLDGRAKDPA